MRARGEVRTPREKSDVLGIQYLRGIAAAMVVAFHLSYQANRLDGSPFLSDLFIGVDIFFVISGFIMVVSTDAGRRILAGQFLVRRLVRIAPLYWVMTTGTVVLLVLVPRAFQSTIFDGTHALASFLFVATANPGSPDLYAPLIVPGWTLCLEMLFYACFAAALHAGQTGDRLVVAASAPIVLLVWVGIGRAPVGMAGFYTNPIMLEFIYGMVLGLSYLRVSIVVPTSFAIVAIAGVVVATILAPTEQAGLQWGVFGIAATVIVGITIFSCPPSIRWLHVVGDSSYSLYLSHFIVVSALTRGWRMGGMVALLPGWVLCAVGLPLCIAVGILCWWFVERPLNRLVTERLSARVFSHPSAL